MTTGIDPHVVLGALYEQAALQARQAAEHAAECRGVAEGIRRALSAILEAVNAQQQETPHAPTDRPDDPDPYPGE